MTRKFVVTIKEVENEDSVAKKNTCKRSVHELN